MNTATCAALALDLPIYLIDIYLLLKLDNNQKHVYYNKYDQLRLETGQNVKISKKSLGITLTFKKKQAIIQK